MVTRAVLEMRGAGALDISVVIAADGQPRMSTLRITGSGAGTQRSAVEQWIRTSTFEPGRRGFVPVDAVFEVELRSVTRVRRM